MLESVNVSMWLGYYASYEEVSSVVLEVNLRNPLGTDDKSCQVGDSACLSTDIIRDSKQGLRWPRTRSDVLQNLKTN